MEKTTFFARTNFRGDEQAFGIKKRDRRQHMYIIGKTGTGKTVLLKNMAMQDVKNGHGLAIVDPHGEFVEEVLAAIPKERLNDVIYFNPADTEYSIGFNVLEVPDKRYSHLVASGLMGIFTKIWANVWSARMEYILNNCILALVETPGSTLLGVPRLLVDKDYREKIVGNITDPVVRSFWVHEYEGYNDRLRSEAIAPIQNKVGQFLNTPLIRNIVGQKTSTMNIDKIMDEGKILLVNVSKGRIGEDNSALLGAMIITKIQLSAMERVRLPEDQRRDFFLYVDEFQNFATESFASILSEARKYRLNLTIAHQYAGQLISDQSTVVRDAVFGNCGTMVTFRVGAADAEFLEPEFTPEFVIQDLVNLPNYNVYIKLMCDGVASRPFSATTLPPIKIDRFADGVQQIIENSRRNYAKPQAEVEKEISLWSSQIDMVTTSQTKKGGKGKDKSSEERVFIPQRPKKFSGHLGKLDIEFDNTQPRIEYSRPPVQHAHQRQNTQHEDSHHKKSVIPKHRSVVQSMKQGGLHKKDAPLLIKSTHNKPGAKEKGTSLSRALKPKGNIKKHEHEKKQIDLDALRKTLADSLEGAKHEKNKK